MKTDIQHSECIDMHLTCVVTLLILIVAVSCGQSDTSVSEIHLPDQIRSIDNVTVITLAKQVSDTVELEQAAVFESSDDIYMEGRLSEFTVDDRGRVYIAATQMGRLGIYVFAPDGEFITQIATYGRGPGEYESIRSIDVHDNQLFLLDARLQKFGIFELDGFTHVKDHVITRNRLTESDSLAKILHPYNLVVTDDSSYILKLRMLPRSRLHPDQPEVYYSLDRTGEMIPGKIFQLKGLSYYFPAQGISTPYLMPFSRSSLVSFADDGRMFTANSNDFLIREYDPSGAYQRAMYFPFENADMSLDEIPLEKELQRMLDQYDLPDTWPALHTMEPDDEEQLWVATITDSDSTFQWHVIDDDGTLHARFTLPGRRASRSAFTKPLVMIRNGFFYQKEQDADTGLERIVKYRISFW